MIHYIAAADHDPHMHDHPWNFVSIILNGGYWERRPIHENRPVFLEGLAPYEQGYERYRRRGTWARRYATDRHLVTAVDRHTWTLVIYGPIRHWWGFYTPAGKIFWKENESAHAALSKEYRGARA